MPAQAGTRAQPHMDARIRLRNRPGRQVTREHNSRRGGGSWVRDPGWAPPLLAPWEPPRNTLADLVTTNPVQLTPVDEANKDKLLTSGLPCAETVHGEGPPGKSRL